MTSLLQKTGILGGLLALAFLVTGSGITFAANLEEPVIENPAAGLKADIDDPFGTGNQIKIDAARDGTLYESVVSIINYLLLFLGLLLLAFIIYAGVLIISSNGDDEALTKGRTIIIYALVGVIIIVLSYTIVNFITDVATGGDAGV